MSQVTLSEIEKEMLLKLSVNEEGIKNNQLDLGDEVFLNNIRKCMNYLEEKYQKKDFTYLFFSPEDLYNKRNELTYTDGGEEMYSVYYDVYEDTITDDYYRKNLTNRYDEWLFEKINQEYSDGVISKVKTNFSSLFGNEVTGNEAIEEIIAKKSELNRDTDVIIANEDDKSAAVEQMKNIANQYGLYGFYRIVLGNEELDYFNTFDIA